MNRSRKKFRTEQQKQIARLRRKRQRERRRAELEKFRVTIREIFGLAA
jgi:hypothetical protein